MIVRELVTRLAFQVDQSGINKANSTISGFKLGFEGIANQAFSFGSQVKDLFDGLYQQSRSFQNISLGSGVDVSKLASITAALGQFNVNTQDSLELFSSLTNDLLDAPFGGGKLAAFTRETGIGFGSLRDGIDSADVAFLKIIEHLSTFKNDTVRTRIAVNLFGKAIGPQLAELAKLGGDALVKETERFKSHGKVVQESVSSLNEYNKSVNEVYTSLSTLGHSAATTFGPAVSSIARGLSSFLEATRSENKDRTRDSFNSFFGIGEKQKEVNITTTNNISINTIPATTETQANEISFSLENTLINFQQQQNRDVMNNNIQLEK